MAKANKTSKTVEQYIQLVRKWIKGPKTEQQAKEISKSQTALIDISDDISASINEAEDFLTDRSDDVSFNGW